MSMRSESAHNQGRQLLVCCGIGFLCFVGAYMRIPVLPLFAASLGANTAQVGMINAAFMLSTGVLAIPSGFLSDRVGQWPMLLGGLLTIAGSSLLIPLSSGPLMMGCVYLLFGAGLAAFAPGMMSLVADVTPANRLGRAYGWYTTAVYIAMTLGPASGGFLAKGLGLRQVFAELLFQVGPHGLRLDGFAPRCGSQAAARFLDGDIPAQQPDGRGDGRSSTIEDIFSSTEAKLCAAPRTGAGRRASSTAVAGCSNSRTILRCP